MTTQKLSSEKLIDFSLFKNLTRRRSVHILVAFLVNFFTLSVPIMMTFGDRIREVSVAREINDLRGIMVLNLIFACGLATYFGNITLGYMMNRRSAHFHHALPQKRETLYFTSVASALFCAFAGAAINLVIVVVEFLIFGLATGALWSTLASLLFKNLIMFLAVYAICVFAGSFSGSGAVQFLMTLVITLYPLVTYLGVLLLRQLFADYFYPEYYFTDKIIGYLSPFAYIAINYIESIKVFPTIIAILVSAALILGGNEIYRRRAIENSERPIVFKKLGSVLKYMFMFTVTAFSGLFFHAIGGGVFYLIFGFVSGAVLSFMLFNTILEKSPKAMFKGAKGLVIFAAVFLAYLLIFCFDVFNIDEYVPDASNLSKAKIEISGLAYEDEVFEDKAMLEALTNVLENQRDSDNALAVLPLYSNSASVRINAIMYTKLGFPIARSYQVSKYTDGVAEFLKLYANDSRMQDEYEERLKEVRDILSSGYTASCSVNLYGYRNVDISIKDFIDVYESEFGKANYDRLSKPIIGDVSIYDFYINNEAGYHSGYRPEYSIFSEMPIYEDMTNTIKYIESLPEFDDTTGEYKYAEDAEITEAEEVLPKIGYIYDTSELRYGGGKFIDLYPKISLGKEQIKEVHALSEKYRSYSNWRVFTELDTDVAYVLYYDEIEEKMAQESEDIYYSEVYVFPRGVLAK